MCIRRLWQVCAGPPGFGRLLRALAAAIAASAAAAIVAAAGSAVAGDSGTRLLRALPHYAAPGLAAGWIAAALAAFHLRSLARNASCSSIAIRTAAHLCAPPLLWLAFMHAGAWFEWQVRRTPIAYGTDWFYAEMYHEYIRDPGGMVLTVSGAAAVAAPLVAVLAAWIACACFSRRQGQDRPRSPPCSRRALRVLASGRAKEKAAPARGRRCNEKVDADQS